MQYDCCDKRCGKSGCYYYPHWIVRWNIDSAGNTRTGSYYGDRYADQTDAQTHENDYLLGDSFLCQWDPTFYSSVSYIIQDGYYPNLEGDFIWMVTMWAILGTWVFVAGVLALYNWSPACRCPKWHPPRPRRTLNPVAPVAYTPPPKPDAVRRQSLSASASTNPVIGDAQVEVAVVASPPPPSTAYEDVAPVQPAATPEEKSGSGSGSASKSGEEIPVY